MIENVVPIIVGSLLPAAERFVLIQVCIDGIQGHLKNGDIFIFSFGWRRFPSIPIYSLDDHSIRMRMLKHAPEHMQWHATFYGSSHFTQDRFLLSFTTATGVVLDGC